MALSAPCSADPDDADRLVMDHRHTETPNEAGEMRDPETDGFGIYCPVLVHDDEALVEELMDNAIVRWLAGTLGRIHGEDWRREGLESPIPDGWSYFQKMLPHSMNTAFKSNTTGAAH
jgi:hypothetical protein